MSVILKTIHYFSRLRTHIYTRFVCGNFADFGARSLVEYGAASLRGLENVAVGSRTVFGRGVRLTTWNDGRIVIGDDCHFGDSNHLTSAFGISVGNNLLTGSNVLFSDNLHGESTLPDMQLPPIERKLTTKGEIHIADNVWIGNNVCVLSGVSIGEGAVIGANSVVTHDVPSYCVAAGAPARVIRQATPST